MRAINFHLRLILIPILTFFWLSVYPQEPFTVLFMLDLSICVYLFFLFKHRFSFLFLLHPFILLINSQLYDGDWLFSGDGKSILAVVSSYLDIGRSNPFPVEGEELQDMGFLGALKFMSLGAVPTVYIPNHFFSTPIDTVYYVWQGTFHVILCAAGATLAKFWDCIKEKYIYSIILFAVISPTFFELGQVPTRHLVTFFGLFMLFVTHVAISKRLEIYRLIWWAIAILIILISKSIYILPYMIFAAVDFFIIRQSNLNQKYILIALIVGLIGVLAGPYFLQVLGQYIGISQTGGNSFSFLTQVPILGIIIKYIYALLAPFPWTIASHYIEGIYTGNAFMFFLHTLSAMTGIYFFTILLFKWKQIWMMDDDFKSLMVYAFIMSLTIMGGSTGFHGYLSIFFPFLAPLLLFKKFRILPIIPLVFPLGLNSVLLFL